MDDKPSETLISKGGVVGIRVKDTMWINGYCFPNVNRQEFDGYIAELEEAIKEGRRRAQAMLVAGDFNAKSTAWGGRRTEPRGTYLLEAITKNELIPIRTTGAYSFVRSGRTSFSDILSASRRMRQSWKKSAVMNWYSASDHSYLLLVFLNNRKRQAGDSINFKYSTKNVDEGKFLSRLDGYLNFMDNDDATHGDQFQERLADELKRILLPRGRRNRNYWWNDELSELRRATLRWRRKAQRAGAADRDNAGLVNEFKEARRKLRRAIERSKNKKWREFCATLEQNPWRRPYRVIRAKMARNGPPESLGRDRVARILDDPFVTSRTEQTEDGHGSRILQTQEEELRDLCVGCG